MKNIRRHAQIINVTPALANEWLKKNTQNRPLRQALVNTYAEAMRRGEWKLTSEPISFANPFTDSDSMKKKGETLMDGQHRLAAIAASGCTIPMTVWFGCDADEFHVLGQGRRRSTADILALTHQELKHPGIVASAVSSFARHGLNYSEAVEPWLVRRILATIGPEVAAVTRYKLKLRRMIGREMLAALLLSELVLKGRTAEIVDALHTGIGLGAEDPVRLIFRYLHEQAVAFEGKDSVETQFYKICYGLMHALRRESCVRLNQTPHGLAYLRNASKAKLDVILAQVHEEVPKNFYDPQISRERLKRLRGKGKFKAKN